jgi:uncharacterized protein YybS (DUF2232 family)
MQNKNYNTRSIVEAGLISALIVILMLINAYVPAFSLVGTFLLPIPVVVLYIRHGYKVAISSVVVSAVLISMLYDPFSALTSAIMFGFIGITLGYCIKHSKKFSITMILLSAASLIELIVNYLIYFTFVSKKNLYQTLVETNNMLIESMNNAQSIYSKFGISTQQIEPMKRAIETVYKPEIFILLIPALLIISSVLSAYLNYIISTSVLKKLRYDVCEAKPFSEIYVNNRVGTVIIVFILLGMLLNMKNIKIGAYVLNSSVILFQVILIFDGITLGYYYLRNKFKMSRGFAILLIFLVAFQPILSKVLMFIGIADMIFDFRKLDSYRRISKV